VALKVETDRFSATALARKLHRVTFGQGAAMARIVGWFRLMADSENIGSFRATEPL